MKKLRNNITAAGLVLTAAFIYPSCKKELTTLNTNPIVVPGTPPEYIFANYTQDFNQNELGLNGNQVGITNFFLHYMQYAVADVQTPQAIENYYWSPTANVSNITTNNPQQDYYGDYYKTYGYALHIIEQNISLMPAAQKATYANINAICQVLDTYEAWRVLDIYGAMPYNQAFQPSVYQYPVYDYEQTLYKTFDSTLKAAATVLQANGNTANQINLGVEDFFYGGDVPSWEAFANTLRIKIAQRYEKRDAGNLASVVSDVSANFKNMVISSNTQSFGVNNTQNYQNNEGSISYIIDYDVSYAFAEFLKSTKDPRLSLMVRQNDFGDNDPDYTLVKQNGTPAALKTLDSITSAANYSRYWGKHASPVSANNAAYGWGGGTMFQSLPITEQPGSDALEYLCNIQTRLFIKNGGFINASYDPKTFLTRLHTDENVVSSTTIQMRTLFLTYAETCFMMAEIAQKSGGSALGQSAASWYNAGVTASVQQYQAAGISAGVPGADTVTVGDYLSRYPYNNTLQQIYSQAWVNFFVQPQEAWAMWKRTGYPQSVSYTPGQTNASGNIGDGSGIAYLENLWDGQQNWILSRRSSFNIDDAGSNLNVNNFNAALAQILKINPDYGVNGLDTRGRTWWDMK